MSSKSKGTLAEKKYQEILEKQEFVVMRSPRTMKRIFVKGKIMYVSQANDFFGLFDIIAKKKGISLYVQVKHEGSGSVREARAKIRRFKVEYNTKGDTFIVAEKFPRKGFKLHLIKEEGYDIGYVNLKGDTVDSFERVKNEII